MGKLISLVESALNEATDNILAKLLKDLVEQMPLDAKKAKEYVTLAIGQSRSIDASKKKVVLDRLRHKEGYKEIQQTLWDLILQYQNLSMGVGDTTPFRFRKKTCGMCGKSLENCDCYRYDGFPKKR